MCANVRMCCTLKLSSWCAPWRLVGMPLQGKRIRHMLGVIVPS
jgi:hypothetical protein